MISWIAPTAKQPRSILAPDRSLASRSWIPRRPKNGCVSEKGTRGGSVQTSNNNPKRGWESKQAQINLNFYTFMLFKPKKMSISKVSDMKHHVRLAGNSCFPSDFLRNFQIFCSRLILDPKACVLFSERTRWRQSGAGHQVKEEKQRAELTRLLVWSSPSPLTAIHTSRKGPWHVFRNISAR